MLSFLKGGRVSRVYNHFRAQFVGLQMTPYREDLGESAATKIIKLDGFSMHVIPHELIGGIIARTGEYEPHVSAFLKRTLKPGDTFVDVGANIGFMTLLAASIVGNSGEVIAAEPNPHNIRLLNGSIRLNGLHNVRVIPKAFSDRETELPFGVLDSNGSILPSPIKNGPTVSTVLADHALSDLTRLDLLKIDIEGHEPYAIRGAEKTIAKFRPIITSEFHPYLLKKHAGVLPEDYLRQLQALGYAISILDDERNPDMTPADIVEAWKGRGSRLAHLDLIAIPNLKSGSG